MNAKLHFTSNDYFHAEREVFASARVPGATHLTVSDTYVDAFLGFGVAITPSSCYELSLMDAEARTALLRHIYGKEGIGLSVARISVGSCDYSAELYSYDEVAEDVELRHFSVARDERYVIPMIKEILAINPDLYLFASPLEPPLLDENGRFDVRRLYAGKVSGLLWRLHRKIHQGLRRARHPHLCPDPPE